MDLSPILARLQDQLTGFKRIGSAADLESLGHGAAPTPAAYLLPLAESAEDNALIGGFDQRLSVQFAVIVAVSNKQDAAGAAAMGDLEPLRAQIHSALLGWAPDASTGEPVGFVSGHLVSFENAQLWWMDEFHVTTYWRKS